MTHFELFSYLCCREYWEHTVIEPVLGIITVWRTRHDDNGSVCPVSQSQWIRGSPHLCLPPPSYYISVTMSDNSNPRFTHKDYQAEVNENVDVGTSVILILPSVSTHLRSERWKCWWDLHHKPLYSGVITTRKVLGLASGLPLISSLSRPPTWQEWLPMSQSVFRLLMKMTMHLFFSFLNIQAASARQPPSIALSGSSDNSPLVIRATDADSNRTPCLCIRLWSPRPRSSSQWTPAQGPSWTIANLDHEAIAHFLFHVHVRDSGSPQLTAESPVWSQHRGDGCEWQPTCVHSGCVWDCLTSNRPMCRSGGSELVPRSWLRGTPELTYSLMEGSLDHFLIDSNSGVLTVKTTTSPKITTCW